MSWYLWILIPLLYLALVAGIFRVARHRGTTETTYPLVIYVSICVFILAIPFMSSPASHVTAVMAVLNLALFYRRNFTPQWVSPSES